MNKRLLNGLLVLLIIIIGYLFLEYVQLLDNIAAAVSGLVPFFIGFAISWLLLPIGKGIHKKTKISLRVSNYIAIFISIAFLLFIFFIFIPVAIREIVQVFDNAPSIIDGIKNTITDVLNWLGLNSDAIMAQLEKIDTAMITEAIHEAANFVLSGFVNVFSAIISTTGFILQFIFGYIIAFYFINDLKSFYRASVKLFAQKHYDTVIKASYEISTVLFMYLRGLFLVCLIIFVFDFIGCTLIGIPAAFLLAVIAAMFNVIPYIGPILGGIPIFLVALSVDARTAVFSLFVVFGAQFIEANFLQPKIMSDNTNLHPVTIIVGLTVFAALFGFIGMVIATPVLAVINIILKYSPWDIRI